MELTVKNLEELPEAAHRLASMLPRSGVVALYGGMGVGKTTLVSALMREMGSTDNVTSPTFALVNDYRTRDGRIIHHFDFYRIASAAEAFDIGYEEYFFGEGLCLVEWPEKIEELLPDRTVRLRIAIMPDGSRTIEV